jgi:hypothetical protein
MPFADPQLAGHIAKITTAAGLPHMAVLLELLAARGVDPQTLLDLDSDDIIDMYGGAIQPALDEIETQLRSGAITPQN